MPLVNRLPRHASERTVVIVPMELHKMWVSIQYNIQFWKTQHEMDPEKPPTSITTRIGYRTKSSIFYSGQSKRVHFNPTFLPGWILDIFKLQKINHQIMLQQIPTTLKQDQISGLDVRGVRADFMGAGFVGGLDYCDSTPYFMPFSRLTKTNLLEKNKIGWRGHALRMKGCVRWFSLTAIMAILGFTWHCTWWVWSKDFSKQMVVHSFLNWFHSIKVEKASAVWGIFLNNKHHEMGSCIFYYNHDFSHSDWWQPFLCNFVTHVFIFLNGIQPN